MWSRRMTSRSTPGCWMRKDVGCSACLSAFAWGSSGEFDALMTAGRPTLYREEYAEQAYKLCLLLGATDADLAAFFDVTEATVNNWKDQYPEFFESVKRGKAPADMHIAQKLFHRAEGAEWEEEQAIKVKTGPHTETVEVVTVKRAAPPDTTAMIFWLKNRQSKKWRDKIDIAGDPQAPLRIIVEHVG